MTWNFPDDLIEAAWGLIANANGGDWDSAPPEWRTAAEGWRDAYHDTLDKPVSASPDERLRAMLDPGSPADEWIDCVLSISAREPSGDHLTSHYVFCRKVLRETRQEALAIAARFRRVELTRETCLRVADGWHDEEVPKRRNT